MLIIEGSDLVGKTTLARALLTHEILRGGGYIYRHLSKLPDGFHRYWHHAALASRCIVQDRFHMSDIVYRRVEGVKLETTPETYRALDGYLRGYGSFTVVVTATQELIASRIGREEMYPPEKIYHANQLYHDLVTEPAHHDQVLQLYRPDWDYHIECTPNHPYPDETDITNILAAYYIRQKFVTEQTNHNYTNLYAK